MIGPVRKGNMAARWAAASYAQGLNSERTNVNQQITRSEAQAIAHNTVGPLQRIDYETEQIGPTTVGRHKGEELPDLTKQNYSSLAQAQMNYHPGDYLPQNYNALGQIDRLQDEAKAGVFINRVV